MPNSETSLLHPRPRVFISYARSDGEEFAKDLRQRLESQHPDIILWQDRTEMEGGVGWWKQIQEALENVEYMVLIATPNAMKSDTVKKEWRYARQQGVCVYPVQVPKSPIEFRSLPHWMNKLHFYDLETEWERFILGLKSPCQQARVPFMAPDLPTGFVKRPHEFDQLIRILLDRDLQNPIAITSAIWGAGGFGKSTLAAALCHDEDVITAFNDGILWITLGKSPNVIDALVDLYIALTGNRPLSTTIDGIATALSENLGEKDCLIVIDDVWDMSDLRPFLRGGENCARLITTQYSEIALNANAKGIEVEEMTPAESEAMLVQGVDKSQVNSDLFESLAKRLGEWPLLLEVANGMLRKRIQRSATPQQAIEWITRVLINRGVLGIERDDNDTRKQGIAGTLAASIEMLEDGEQQHYVELAVFPEDTDIPLTTLSALWNLDNFQTEELAERLADRCLLHWNPQYGTIRVHDVILEYLGTKVEDTAKLHDRLLNNWGNLYSLPDTYAWQYVARHLLKAGDERVTELRALLLNLEWLQAKLNATDINALISDFDIISQDGTLYMVQEALRLSSHVLASDKNQLVGQITARLAHAENPERSSPKTSVKVETWHRTRQPSSETM